MAPAALVGVCLGLAFGLEQSSAFYAVAGCAAFLLLPGPFWRRFGLSFVFGLGVLAGLAAAGGHWMLYLWQHYANPLFPFCNHLFRSPWGLPRDYRDPGFLPSGFDLWEVLSFPWRANFDYRLSSEVPWRDFRVLACYLLLPLAGLAVALRRGRQAPAPLTLPAFPPQLRFLRIDSNFTNIHERQVAFNPLMQRIVAAHEGPLAVLDVAEEDGGVRRKLTEYGLAMDAAPCQPLRANLALDGPDLYCPVFR
jgi:hypothetical protein